METELKLFFWIGTAILFFSVFSVVLIVSIYLNKINKKRRKESDDLLKISLDSEKRERKRIASDLHDSISGDLSAVQNYITLLNSKEKDDFNKSIFQEVENALGKILENVQDISYNLVPPMLEDLGLISTLRSYFERVRKWHSINLIEKYQSENILISSSDAYELYLIIQELITNMIKHGKCSEIVFDFYERNKVYVFEVADNGISFDFYKNLKAPSGMGLKNITSRIKHIEATLIQLPSEKGNKIQIHLNLKSNVTNSHN